MTNLPDNNIDWRRDAITKFARRMLTNCGSCPICGSMVCSDNDRLSHKSFHQNLNDNLTQLRDAVTADRTRLTRIEGVLGLT